MRSIALVTASADVLSRDADTDAEFIVGALRAEGVEPTFAVWDDTTVDWDAFDAIIIRSPWDYSDRADEFLAWMDRTARDGRFFNAPEVIRWSLDKSYLLELQALGVPVVPTTLASTMAEAEKAIAKAGERVVIKPTVSAGSRDTGLFTAADPGTIKLAEQILSAGKTVMIQPAIDSVARVGEVATLYYDGTFAYSARKGPLLAEGGGLLADMHVVNITAHVADPETRVLTDQTIEAIATVLQTRFGITETPLYARIDTVAGEDGPLLLEAELFEPSYFLETAPEHAADFAAAVARRLRKI